MKRLLPAVCLAVALTVTADPARAEGINLSWDECGSSGIATKSWTCDSDDGQAFKLVASVVAPANVQEVTAIEYQVDVEAGVKLPEWWKHGLSVCRGDSAISLGFEFGTGVTPCADFTGGLWSNGMALDSPSGNRVRMRLFTFAPQGTPANLVEGSEYYVFTLQIRPARTTACAGCAIDACIVLNSLQFYQTPVLNHDPLLVGAGAGGRNHVTWQSEKVLGCPNSTPVRNATWGTVKSLYR